MPASEELEIRDAGDCLLRFAQIVVRYRDVLPFMVIRILHLTGHVRPEFYRSFVYFATTVDGASVLDAHTSHSIRPTPLPGNGRGRLRLSRLPAKGDGSRGLVRQRREDSHVLRVYVGRVARTRLARCGVRRFGTVIPSSSLTGAHSPWWPEAVGFCVERSCSMFPVLSERPPAQCTLHCGNSFPCPATDLLTIGRELTTERLT